MNFMEISDCHTNKWQQRRTSPCSGRLSSPAMKTFAKRQCLMKPASCALLPLLALLLLRCGNSESEKTKSSINGGSEDDQRVAQFRSGDLREAAKIGDIGRARTLIDQGANINERDEYGTTPLALAAGLGHRDLVELLIAKGADLNSQDHNGDMPLYWAASKGYGEIVTLLITKGANVKLSNSVGHTTLHIWARHSDSAEIAALIISRGADVNAQMESGVTPLHLASGANHINIASVLIDAGASTEIKNENGETPLCFAVRERHSQMVRFLISHGADLEALAVEGDSPHATLVLAFGKFVTEALLDEKNSSASSSSYPDGSLEAGIAAYRQHDLRKAYDIFQRLAEQGSTRAEFNLGLIFATAPKVSIHSESPRQDYKEALRRWERAAIKGHARAQVNVGLLYDNGLGTAVSHSDALKWYQRAAERGDARAVLFLEFSDSFSPTEIEGSPWIRPAHWYENDGTKSEAGDEFRLGMLYREQGNYSNAVKWYLKAASDGDLAAANDLAVMYFNGNGVQQNYSEAVKWFSRAAALGSPRAQYSLGLCYYEGKGVNQDREEAMRWFREAARQGDEQAIEVLSRFSS